MTDILELAERARAIADGAPTGSPTHAAAGAVAVTCATTRDITQAREVLDGVAPGEVRRDALDLFDRLLAESA